MGISDKEMNGHVHIVDTKCSLIFPLISLLGTRLKWDLTLEEHASQSSFLLSWLTAPATISAKHNFVVGPTFRHTNPFSVV